MTADIKDDSEAHALPLPDVEVLSDYEIEVIPQPHVEELTRADLELKARQCEANGESADFYVGILQRLDAYEAQYAATQNPAKSAPSPAPASKGPGAGR